MSAHCCIKLDLFINIDSKCKEPWVKKKTLELLISAFIIPIYVLCDQSVIFSLTCLVHFTQSFFFFFGVESSWNVMTHGDARGGGKWKRNWRMEWVASTLHTTSEHGVSSITTADAHSSPASNRMNWNRRRFKWFRPFRRKMKSRFCTCAITFQLASTSVYIGVGGPWRKYEWPSVTKIFSVIQFNPLNPELNPICYLLALLAHHFLHVSKIRVKSLTIRLLMSYIYGAPILDVSRSHTTTHHSR